MVIAQIRFGIFGRSNYGNGMGKTLDGLKNKGWKQSEIENLERKLVSELKLGFDVNKGDFQYLMDLMDKFLLLE